MSKSWSSPTTEDEVARRAAGRRRYNSRRTLEKNLRRQQVLQLLHLFGKRHGVQTRIARILGVSESTVSRDVDWLLTGTIHFCPTCRQRVDHRDWHDLITTGRVASVEEVYPAPERLYDPNREHWKPEDDVSGALATGEVVEAGKGDQGDPDPICPACWHGIDESEFDEYRVIESDEYRCERGHAVEPVERVMVWVERIDGAFRWVESPDLDNVVGEEMYG